MLTRCKNWLLIYINQEQVYRTKVLDVEELKRCISTNWAVWAALSHTVIECADGEWL